MYMVGPRTLVIMGEYGHANGYPLSQGCVWEIILQP